jgi:tripartite-type tricarboxylate transporter receptor subunit TctC
MFQQAKNFLCAFVSFLGLVVSIGAPALAQAPYPNKPVTMIIGFPAGGYADRIARIVGQRVGERLGQNFIAQNLDGAGGLRATRQVVSSAPDGYTILVTTTSIAINETLFPDRGYKADQLAAVAIPVSAPESITANNDAGIKSVADMVKLARDGKIYLGTPGLGTGSQIAQEYFFKVLLKADVRYITFAGGAPALLGLMSGDTNVMAGTATGGPLRNIQSGQITGIAVAAKERSSLLPNVPTFSESGYPGFEASSWAGFFVPAGTPAAITELLNKEINAVMQEDKIKATMDSLGLELFLRNQPDTETFFLNEIKNWSKMVDAVGVGQ